MRHLLFLYLFTAYICFPSKVDFCIKNQKSIVIQTCSKVNQLFGIIQVTLFFIELLVYTMVHV